MSARTCRLLALLLATGCAPLNVHQGTQAVAPAKSGLVRLNTPDGPQNSPLSLHSGQLANGLTYYALRSPQPRARVCLWLVVKAGSVLEDDDQRGAAHFVEHMAFNGTRSFPKLEIMSFMRNMGMQLGSDLNGTTVFESTEYKLTVPTDVADSVSKGLSFLRDVTDGVSFDPAEVEQERHVVLEEWREGRAAAARVWASRVELMLQGSRYASRLPIGSPEVLRNVTRGTLLRFYRDWYRPDAMAVIAVGDADAGELEQEIKQKFGDLPASTNERIPDVQQVPFDDRLDIQITTDPELTATTIALDQKLAYRSAGASGDLRRELVEIVALSLLRARLQLGRGLEAPFFRIDSGASRVTRNLAVLGHTATVKETSLAAGVRSLLAELASASRYGFSAGELSGAKQWLSVAIDIAFSRADAELSQSLAGNLAATFLGTEYFRKPDAERALTRRLLPTVTLDEVNAWASAHAGERGKTLLITAPAGVPTPSEEQVRSWAKEASLDPPGLPAEAAAHGPLLAQSPKPGSVVETTHDPVTDVTLFKLSNGVKVAFKRWNIYGQAVRVWGLLPGGLSRVADQDLIHARLAGDIADRSGAGTRDEREIRQLLLGKQASVSLELSELWGIVNVTTSTQDLETALQLAYMRLTQPRQSAEAFSEWKAERLEYAGHRDASPDAKFWETALGTVKATGRTGASATTADIERFDAKRAYAIWRERFSNVNGATFFVLGDVEPSRLQPLLEAYLGSLPAKAEPATWKDPKVRYPTGKVEKTVYAGHEPRSKVMLEFAAPDRVSFELERDLEIFEQVLETRLSDTLREGIGGVYSVSARAWTARDPQLRRMLRITFDCAPENVDSLRQAVFDELAQLARSGIGREYLEPVARRLRRAHEARLLNSDYWLETMRRMYVWGDDYASINDTEAVLGRVTSENVQATARRLFDTKNHVLVVLRPAPQP